MKKKILFSSLLVALSYGVFTESYADSLPSALNAESSVSTIKNIQSSTPVNPSSVSVPSALLPNQNKTDIKTNPDNNKPVKIVNLTTAVKPDNKTNLNKNIDKNTTINPVVNNPKPITSNTSTVIPTTPLKPMVQSKMENHVPVITQNISTTNNNQSNVNSETETLKEKNKPSVEISVNNPFTGNSALKANLISDYNIWNAKNKVLKEMVKYQKEKNLLQEAEAASGGESANPNSPVNQAENKEVSTLQNQVSDLQSKISDENSKMVSMEQVYKKNKKEIANQPKLVSVIRYDKEYSAIIKTGEITKSYKINGMVNGNFIQAISPNSVTFNNGKVINLSTNSSGYIAKAAWSGYPKHDGLGGDTRLSGGHTAHAQPMHIPTYPGEPVQPYHLPKGTLPSMN